MKQNVNEVENFFIFFIKLVISCIYRTLITPEQSCPANTELEGEARLLWSVHLW